MPSTFSTNQNGIYVTVNGTANFYLGAPSQASEHTAPVIAKGEPIALVAPEKKLRFDPNYATREGYDDNFLEGFNIPLPKVSDARMSEVLVEQPGTPRVLKYHHFSLIMNAKRKLTMWSATNVDYSDDKRWRNRDEFGTDTWIPDPRIPGELQIQDPEFYAPAAKFDRGHIVRREDNAWGDDQLEEEFANSDTFHWTNCTPQHERFNRDAFGYKGLWGKLENHIKEQAAAVGNRMTIFAGPILDNAGDLVHDFGPGDIQLPLRFWKVVVVIDGRGAARKLRAYGFILDQKPAIDRYGLEGFRIGEFSNYHVALNEITADSGVVFPQVLLEADLLHAAAPERRRVKFNSLENVRVR